ncbi:hypothetical protein GCM10008949_25350 [Deinococcus humi]|nr:hypothetical protein GCM10008949_25350 [Deinococcus humi]
MRAAAEIGYEALDLVPHEYWALVKAHGLRIACIAGHGSILEGLCDAQHHGRIVTELTQTIALARHHDIANLVCFAGSSTTGSDESAIAASAEVLRRVTPIAEDAGVTLILELLNSRVDHPGYRADRTAWGVAVCRAVESPRMKLLYDIYHMQIMEGDLIRSISEYHPYFAHYHTAGNPGRNEINGTQEIYYPAVLRAIQETGFDGYVAHEFVPRGSALSGLREAFSITRG